MGINSSIKDDYFKGIGPVKNIFQLIGYISGGM